MKAMKNTVHRTHKMDIEELFFRQKELNDDYQTTKQKVLKIEDKIPKLIREMINFYFDQRFETRFSEFITKEEFNERISLKMDYSLYKEYRKKEMEKEETD
mmetsp:Transcript_5547/g.8725  ORF Transcript_5547/g.8725 Transcript_5547/m.8725 type:complete len:101 (+) Transcript_5547:159-461(+)